jgi:hypothetical protein
MSTTSPEAEDSPKVSAIESMMRHARDLKLDDKQADAFMERYLYLPARDLVRSKGGMMNMFDAEEEVYQQFQRNLNATHKPLLIDILEDIAEHNPEYAEVLERWKKGDMPPTREGRKMELSEATKKFEIRKAREREGEGEEQETS